jgi:hypothetical protein
MARFPESKRLVSALAIFAFCWGAGAAGAQAAPQVGALGDPATAVGLVPHKALYDVRLKSAKNGSQVVNIRGQMLFEWKPSCGGWITNHKFRLSYDYADAPAMNIESDFSTFESFDNSRIDFSSRRRKDGEVYEDLRGKAQIALAEASQGSGKIGQAVYTLPSTLSFDLTQGTVFPTSHTMSLVKSARDGKKFMRSVVFDGSDDEGPVEINSFIAKKFEKGSRDVLGLGNQSKAAAAKQKIDAALVAAPGWKIAMAFFPTKTDEETSDYELTMAFHENGIISDMLIDYGDFTVTQRLMALEKVAPDACGN